ncbi:MAG: hypothetical protein IJ235_01920 [Eubacterium sp.]|nr:hypothetical protein [Eubacterium sp.]MBR2278080.1 hypothetical protein [Eubacterium sp.]
MIELKGYKIESINFENNVPNGTQLKLQNQVKYNVNYIDAENRCIGILDFRITDADMNPFEIRIKMVAEFTYTEGEQKPDIHTGSFDQMFPFLRQSVNGLTAMAGMPGLLIPMMKLDKNSVSVNNNAEDENESSPLN